MITQHLGSKLTHLWKTIINEQTGKPYSVAEISVITEHLGSPVSHGYWYKILKGKHRPSAEKVVVLSQLFGVSTDYLLNDDIDTANVIHVHPHGRSTPTYAPADQSSGI